MADGILVPQPGTEPRLSAVRAWSPNHWTGRESPPLHFGVVCYIANSDSPCYLIDPSTIFSTVDLQPYQTQRTQDSRSYSVTPDYHFPVLKGLNLFPQFFTF